MKLKKIVVVCLVLITFSLTSRPQKPVKMPIKVRKINDRVMVLSIGFLQTIALSSEKGLVVIDTNRGQSSGREIRQRIVEEFGRNDFIYLINTHYHADHTLGNYLFPNVTILSHALCRELLDTRGRKSLGAAKKQGTTFRQARIVLP